MSARVPVTPIDAAEITAYDTRPTSSSSATAAPCVGRTRGRRRGRRRGPARATERWRRVVGIVRGEMYLGGGTPIQEACGFTDTAEEMEKFLLAALGPDADQEKVGPLQPRERRPLPVARRPRRPFKPSLWDSPPGCRPPTTA
ncbi:hypothetical protein GS421_08210 [Rhodococcus hoagii]|nr:hypothetical protein [Prescottella equi]